jgi:superoxide reductase
MIKQKFLICKHCGNMVAYVKESGVPIICCGEEMTELIPGTTDASKEKHVPVISVDGNIVTVTVGSIEHPMLPEHYIEWISLQTEQGNQRKELKPGDKPIAVFALADGDTVIAAYEYCNLHSLWKKEV